MVVLNSYVVVTYEYVVRDSAGKSRCIGVDVTLWLRESRGGRFEHRGRSALEVGGPLGRCPCRRRRRNSSHRLGLDPRHNRFTLQKTAIKRREELRECPLSIADYRKQYSPEIL